MNRYTDADHLELLEKLTDIYSIIREELRVLDGILENSKTLLDMKEKMNEMESVEVIESIVQEMNQDTETIIEHLKEILKEANK